MLTYLPLLLLQPWKVLSRRQRRFVWRECVHPLMTRWPMMLAKFVLLFLVCYASVAVLSDNLGWRQYLTFFFVMFFTTDVFDMILVARFRQRIIDYIREHGQEIQSVA